MDQLRRWVHRHSDASSPHQGGRSAGSLGGAAIISRCSGGWGIRRTWVEVGVGVGVGKCVGRLGEVMRGWGSVGCPRGRLCICGLAGSAAKVW